MTPFEYWVTMALSIAAGSTCTLSDNYLLRCAATIALTLMVYFAGMKGGVMI